jgi:hypothetical protein
MEKKDEYQKMLNSQLKEWNVLITLLAEKVENAGADVKLMYVQELDEIRGKQRDAVKKIEELEGASGDAWESSKISMDMVGYNLGTGLAHAITKFR